MKTKRGRLSDDWKGRQEVLGRDLPTPIIAGGTILLLSTEGGAYDGSRKHGDRKGAPV